MARMSLMENEGSAADGPAPSTGAVSSSSNSSSSTAPACSAAGPEGPPSSSCRPIQEQGHSAKLPCAFYMRTGTCAYGERCKFYHPADRPQVFMNSRGLPLRPEEPECNFYMRHGWCAFSDTCKFHHPELPQSQLEGREQQRGGAGAGAGPRQSDGGGAGGPAHKQQQQHHGGPGSGQSRQQQQQRQQPYHQVHMHPMMGSMQPMPAYGVPMHGLPVAHMGPGPYYRGHMAPAHHQQAMRGMGYPPATSAMLHPVMHMRPGYMPVAHGPYGPAMAPPLAQQMAGLRVGNGGGGQPYASSGGGKGRHGGGGSGGGAARGPKTQAGPKPDGAPNAPAAADAEPAPPAEPAAAPAPAAAAAPAADATPGDHTGPPAAAGDPPLAPASAAGAMVTPQKPQPAGS